MKLNIGDKVRCIFGRSYITNDRYGKLATIVNTPPTTYNYHVVWDDGEKNHTEWGNENSFELIKETELSASDQALIHNVTNVPKVETIFLVCKRKYYGIDCSCPLCPR